VFRTVTSNLITDQAGSFSERAESDRFRFRGTDSRKTREKSKFPIEARADRFRFAGVRIVCHNESERSSIVVHAFQRHAGRSHRKRRAFGDLDGLGIDIEGACLITGVGRKIRSEPNSRARSGLRAGRPFFGDYRS
jgi:hypothetical protein